MKVRVSDQKVIKLVALWFKWQDESEAELAKKVYCHNWHYDWVQLDYLMTKRLNLKGYNFGSIFYQEEAQLKWIEHRTVAIFRNVRS